MDYGIKIAIPNKTAKSINEDDLAFTSQYPILKAKVSGFTHTGAGTKIITHSLGYKPAFLVYAKGTNYFFKLPRFFLGVDPVSGGVSGYCYVDKDYLYIVCPNADIYYYIFVDPI